MMPPFFDTMFPHIYLRRRCVPHKFAGVEFVEHRGSVAGDFAELSVTTIHSHSNLRNNWIPSADATHNLNPLDSREPRRCAVVVESRLNPLRFDGKDIPSMARVE